MRTIKPIEDPAKFAEKIRKESSGSVTTKIGSTAGHPVIHIIDRLAHYTEQSNTIHTEGDWVNHPRHPLNKKSRKQREADKRDKKEA